MKIINQKVIDDIVSGNPLRINLGSGPVSSEDDFYNLDVIEAEGVDIVADLNEPLDAFPDRCVHEVRTRHTLEHIRELIPLLTEPHRVLHPEGRIQITVPHFSNPFYYSDPTHVRTFGLYTFFYFCDEQAMLPRSVPFFYTDTRFRVEKVRIDFYYDSFVARILNKVVRRLVNRSYWSLNLYERHFCWIYPAHQIYYELSAVAGRPTNDNK